MTKGILNIFCLLIFLMPALYSGAQQPAPATDTTVQIVEPPVRHLARDTIQFDKLDPNFIPVVAKRKIPDSVLLNLQQDEAFWYANLAKKKQAVVKEQPSALATLLQQKWFKTLLWILIVALFAAVLLWYLTSINIKLFRKRSTLIQTGADEKLTENIFSISYEKRIQEAVQNNNYRLAVRLLYLQALKHLSNKKLILFQQDKTNSEYLAQLYNTAYYKDFFNLTRSFEYTWYGQFALSKTAFEIVQKDFETFNRQLAT